MSYLGKKLMCWAAKARFLEAPNSDLLFVEVAETSYFGICVLFIDKYWLNGVNDSKQRI